MSKLVELEQDTKNYWEMSLAFNGRAKESNTTVEKAISDLCKILDRTNSARKLAYYSTLLLDEVIGKNRRPKTTMTNPDSSPIKLKEEQISAL